MQLLQLYYNAKGKTPKYLLLLYLGQKDRKLIGIQSDKITGDEFAIVRKNLAKLNDMSLTNAVYWFKQHCPNSYKNGYREIKLDNVASVNKHNL